MAVSNNHHGNNNHRLIQEIEDQFLICKICYDSYKKPKTLSCLHIFCTSCLEAHMDAELARLPAATYSNRYLLYHRTIACPVCRKKSELPAGGVCRLPDNFLVENLTQVLTRRKHTSNLPMCGICLPTQQLARESREAVCRCLDCFKLLCRSCVELHRRTRVTAEHSLVDVEDQKDISCKEHPEEVVRFYCEHCDKCICVICAFQDHRNHEVSSFVDGIQKYSRSMDAVMALCQDRVLLLQRRLEVISRCESVIQQAEERIRETAVESMESIRRREKQMLDDLHVAYGEETMEYIHRKSSIQEAIDNLMSACNMTDIMLKDKGLELLLLKKDIQEKMEDLVNVDEIPPPENVSRQIKFRPGALMFGSLNFVEPASDSGEEELVPIVIANGCSTMVDSFEVLKPGCESMDSLSGIDSFPPFLISGGRPLHRFFSDVKYVDSSTSTTNPNPVEVGVGTNVEYCDKEVLTQPATTANSTTDMEDFVISSEIETQTLGVQLVHSAVETEMQQLDSKNTNTDPPSIEHMCIGTDIVISKDMCISTVCPELLDTGVNPDNPGVVDMCDTGVGDHTAVTSDTGCVTLWSGTTSTDAEVMCTPRDLVMLMHGDSAHFRNAMDQCTEFDIEMEDSVTNTIFTQFVSQGTSTDSDMEDDEFVDSRDNLSPALLVNDVQLIPILSFETVGTTMNSIALAKDGSVNTDTKTYVHALTSTEHQEQEDKFTSTWIRNYEQGTNTTTVTMVEANTNTRLVETKDQSACSHVISLDKATYMPSPVFITTGTCTPYVDFGEKGIGTERVETQDRGVVTHQVKLQEQGVNTQSVRTDEISCNTETIQMKDVALDKFTGYCTDVQTNTVTLEFVDTGTEPVFGKPDTTVCTNTEIITVQEVAVETMEVETNEVSVTCKPSTRDVGVYKRPHTISRKTWTENNTTAEKSTLVEIPSQDSFSMTEPSGDHKETSTIGLVSMNSVCTETTTVNSKSSYTAMVQRHYIDRAASPFIERNVDKANSPIRFSGQDKSIEAFASTVECGSMATEPTQTTDRWSNTKHTELCSRQTSPERPFTQESSCLTEMTCSVDAATTSEDLDRDLTHSSTNTAQREYISRASSPVFKKQKMTDSSAMAMPDYKSQETNTRYFSVNESSTSTPTVHTADNTTEMPQVPSIDKETSTSQIHVMHKNVCTENINTCDKQTSTTIVDVAAAYKKSLGDTPKSFITRGTCTPVLQLVHREVSTIDSSPPRMLDKSTSVSKADLLEPIEKYQRPGGGKRSVMDPSQFSSLLSSIGEDSKESGSSDEEALSMHTHRLAHRNRMSSSAPNLRPASCFIETTFRPIANGNPCKPIRCTIETGTSTPPVEMEDKAISTEAYVVNYKMAECITKLRTVSQRLDQNSPPSNSPIYSRVDMASIQGVSLAASSPQNASIQGVSLAASSTQNGAIKSGQNKPSAQSGASPFFSPPLPRRTTESSFWSPGLRHKARKQKVDMKHMLNSPTEQRSDLFANLHSEQSTSSETYVDVPAPEVTKEKSPKKKKTSKKEKRARHKSGESSSPFSSPERLKERLQRILPAFDTPPKKPKEKIIVARSARMDRHRIDKKTREQIQDALQFKVVPPTASPTTKKRSLVERVVSKLRRTPNSTPEASPNPGRKFDNNNSEADRRPRGALTVLIGSQLSQFGEEHEEEGHADDDNISRESII